MSLMPEDYLNKNFCKFRNELILYSNRFNVSYEDREEMINDSIMKALDSFDIERGSFESLCRIILKNKIINFRRDNRDVFFLIALDENEAMLPYEERSYEEKENNDREHTDQN